MAIRFQCGSCDQPIEVDDEWASKVVACPYCHKTVTAPAKSTMREFGEIHTASPLHASTADAQTSSEAVAAPNTVGLTAFVLALVLIALIVITARILSAHYLEIEELNQAVAGAGDFSNVLEAQREFLEAHGGKPPGWLLALMAFYLLAGLDWIAVLVCGIIGVRRVHRRGMAIFALVVAGLFPMMFCCSGLLG